MWHDLGAESHAGGQRESLTAMNIYWLQVRTFGFGSSLFCVVKADTVEEAEEKAAKRYPELLTTSHSMAPCQLIFDDSGVSDPVEFLW